MITQTNVDYDTIVVGAGPAGSTAARLLAQRGARVLLLDRARFPRDKPCGGGVSIRAAGELGVDLSPVIERTVTEMRVSFRLGRSFLRSSPEPLAYLTQRCRLDALLVERAAEAGVDFRDGQAVRDVELADAGVLVGAHITTLPAIPVSRFEPAPLTEPFSLEADRGLSPPKE